jgi:hypothetical protein
MNVKLKSGIILTATLILGMVLGSLITGKVMRNRVYDRLEALRTERGFVDRIERLIRPDDHQREEVNRILSRHFGRMREVGKQMHEEFDAINDSLVQDLSQVLRPEQLERFKKRLKKMRRFGPPGRPGHRKPMRDKRENSEENL